MSVCYWVTLCHTMQYFITYMHAYMYAFIYIRLYYINTMYTFEEKNTPSRYLGVKSRWDPVFILWIRFFNPMGSQHPVFFNP